MGLGDGVDLGFLLHDEAVKTVKSSRTRFAGVQHDRGVLTAHVLPVFDLAGENLFYLFPGKSFNSVRFIYDDNDCVPANRNGNQTRRLVLLLQIRRLHAYVQGAVFRS